MNWNALRRLRARFLQFDPREPEAAGGFTPDHSDYWRSHSELASYDFTFGERIGWKWDTVLAELNARGWTPPEGRVLDWGCGTGIAGRRAMAAWRPQCKGLALLDRSGPAQQFAAARARETFPGLPVEIASKNAAPDLLLVSHVLNELTSESLENLLALAARAQAVLWVEPGTAPVSAKLIAVRERLRERFRVLAPCPHQEACGMLVPDNARHWCHHFAKVPGFVHTDPGWGRFAQTLEIDFASVPFSFLVLDRRPVAMAAETGGNARVIGFPRHYKGFAKVLSCQNDGVRERLVQKRDSPELFKAMKKDPGSLYIWQSEGEKIRDAERVF